MTRKQIIVSIVVAAVLIATTAIGWSVYADALDRRDAALAEQTARSAREARQKAIQAELSAGSEKMMKEREEARAAAEEAERIAEAERVAKEEAERIAAEAEAAAQAERDAQAAARPSGGSSGSASAPAPAKPKPSGTAPAPNAPAPSAPAPAPVQTKKIWKCKCGQIFNSANAAIAHQDAIGASFVAGQITAQEAERHDRFWSDQIPVGGN